MKTIKLLNSDKTSLVDDEDYKWIARIAKDKFRNVILGVFDNEIEAALAYDDAALIRYSEIGALNFPLYGA